jgi:LruC domain-containing protein
MTNSAVSTVVYSIQAAAPVFTPGEGTYAYARTIAITSATTFASIRYTTDGSTPTSTSGTVYSSEITVSATTTIKAIAYKSGYADSDVSSATFTIQAAAVEDPSFSPDGGIYASEQSVAINTATTGASIRYTTDGTTPTASVGTIYSSAITISANTTLKAIAYKSGFTNSNVNTAVYGIRVATPAFSPIPGAFTTAQNITLTTATSGATIYFTTDGTTPTVSSTLYSAPIFLNSTATIKALAVKAGMTNSIILSGTFNIQLLTVANPTFTPAAGTYNSDQSVTIVSATEGASIRYTTNGTLPTASVGTLYTAAIALSASSDFKAIAFKDGLLDSEVALSSYVLKCVTPSFNPPAGNIDRPQVITISATTAGSTVRYSTDGSEPTESTGIIYSAPVQVNTGQTLKAIAYKTGYTKSETGIAAYTLTSPDTDGDGVVDPEDEYPNDSQRALNTFYPAAGNGTVAFEDLWPAKGDYDMNDVVVDYNFRTVTNGSNQLVETFATFVLRASGAALHNGFGFEFANNIIPASAITVTGSRLTKIYITLGENGLEANQAKPVVVVFDNVFDLLANQGSGSGFNTTPGANFVDPVTINIHIVYTANTYSAEGLDLEHFNPFIIVNMERGKEVHLADHAPTSLADMSLFGTLEDNSVPAEGRYYRTSTNAPWALNIPESFDYPIEKTVILKAYPHFADWVQSGGTLFTDWYKNLSGYRHTEFIYQKN